MEGMLQMINDGLRRTSVRLKTTEIKLFGLGKIADHFIDKQTPRKKYTLEVLLTVPHMFILHQWCLLAPSSSYIIVNFLLFLLWGFVSLCLLGGIFLNIRTRLRMYTVLCVDIMVAWVTPINYWTFQQIGHETCLEEVNVILWTDITNNYTMPVIFSIFARCMYLWIRLAAVGNYENGVFQIWVQIGFVATLLPDVLCMIGLFPTFMSELSYCLHITVFVIAFSYEVFTAHALDIEATGSKIEELREMAENEGEKEKKDKYIAEAKALNEQLQIKRSGDLNIRRIKLPGQWFMRDNLSACALLYFSVALATELVRCQMSTNDIPVTMTDFVVSVFARWCTSIVTLAFFSSLLTCITNLCIGFSFFFLTTEARIADVMNTNTGGPMFLTNLIFFSETSMLGLAYSERNNAMKIVLFFSFYFIMFQNLDVIKRKVLDVVNSGIPQEIAFYLRFGILMGLFVTISFLTTCIVSQSLRTDFLSLFLAAGNHHLIIMVLFMIVECLLVSLKWHTVQHRGLVEDIINYSQITMTILTMISSILQAYFRYFCPYFQAWWVYRLSLASFGASVTIGIAFFVQWKLYKSRQGLIQLMNDLPDVNFEQSDDVPDCSICFSELICGKVLPCAHSFHQECLRHWFPVRRVCPVCNNNV